MWTRNQYDSNYTVWDTPSEVNKLYIENHIYKRRNRRSILAKRRGAEAQRIRDIEQYRIAVDYCTPSRYLSK